MVNSERFKILSQLHTPGSAFVRPMIPRKCRLGAVVQSSSKVQGGSLVQLAYLGPGSNFQIQWFSMETQTFKVWEYFGFSLET